MDQILFFFKMIIKNIISIWYIHIWSMYVSLLLDITIGRIIYWQYKMFTPLKKGPKVGIYIVSAGFKDISVLYIKHSIQQENSWFTLYANV